MNRSSFCIGVARWMGNHAWVNDQVVFMFTFTSMST